MQVTVSGYEHARGNHCGTTSISRLLRFHGHRISEAMCLGLGEGLEFVYLTGPSLNPTRYIGGRGPYLETTCFRNLGVPCTVHQTADPAEAWRWVKNEIDAGRPAMVQADIRWLDYYNTKTRFGGHKILVVGYDEEKQTATISDNEFDQLQPVPLDSLARARAETAPPFELQNDWFEIRVPERLADPAVAVPLAIVAQAEKMLADRGELFGVAALERAARELPAWREAADWQWSARFAYQVIEKRGTGGGSFRKMYADFLAEGAVYCPAIEWHGLPERMRRIAAAWTALGVELRALSEQEPPADFRPAAALLAGLARAEREYYSAARACRG
ncbi:MAG: BtrH N-terminal domain-containing protein [Myxococcales bacterium]|nr:BtrH N-terminal domain-containing protein [Myxococcales bacterium]